ncbi:MAG: RtcB family protein [Acidobacteriota bacterium]
MKQLYDKAYIWTDPANVEQGALQQIKNVSQLPFIFRHVAVMPDCHYGKGATVGTVIATKGAVVPAAVGVDIGCGMLAVRTPLKREAITDLPRLREGIERRIPMSAGRNNSKITETAKARIGQLETAAKKDYSKIDPNWRHALGTLGGGNHFIELATDTDNTVWLTLHSGSRGVGNKIGNKHIRIAQASMERRNIALPDRDLAYLSEGTPEFHNYIDDLQWAQLFAKLNRDEMMDRVMLELSYQLYGDNGHLRELEEQRINCHHNFSQMENHFGQDVLVTRKGAIQAKKGMWAMIPGSMGTRSYIVQGLENTMAFHSAPHGAGRRYSRTKAKQLFTMKDLETSMAGIEFRKSGVLIDEIPGAYKDIDQVIEDAKDLVEVKYILKQFINMKGD